VMAKSFAMANPDKTRQVSAEVPIKVVILYIFNNYLFDIDIIFKSHIYF
jgi:hypothetical protein